MLEFFQSDGAFELHDALRSVNAVLAMWCLGLITGMWPIIRHMVTPVKQLWAGGIITLTGLIVGSWEAIHLDTPPTIRTPIFTVALILTMIGIIRTMRHPRILSSYRKPRNGAFSMSQEGTRNDTPRN